MTNSCRKETMEERVPGKTKHSGAVSKKLGPSFFLIQGKEFRPFILHLAGNSFLAKLRMRNQPI